MRSNDSATAEVSTRSCVTLLDLSKPLAPVTMKSDTPLNFLRALMDGVIAGATADVVVETVLYPIDTIKNRLQASAPVFIGIYEPTEQKLLKYFPETLSALAHSTVGMVAGIAASLTCVPTEVAQQRMETGQFTSAPDDARFILTKEGFRGLYAGYGSFLLRDRPSMPSTSADMSNSDCSAITGAITMPMDVMTARLMVQVPSC